MFFYSIYLHYTGVQRVFAGLATGPDKCKELTASATTYVKSNLINDSEKWLLWIDMYILYSKEILIWSTSCIFLHVEKESFVQDHWLTEQCRSCKKEETTHKVLARAAKGIFYKSQLGFFQIRWWFVSSAFQLKPSETSIHTANGHIIIIHSPDMPVSRMGDFMSWLIWADILKMVSVYRHSDRSHMPLRGNFSIPKTIGGRSVQYNYK